MSAPEVATAEPSPVRSTRYAVEAISFLVVDESGVDLFGSDEPHWGFETTTADGTVLVERLFGDADSGDQFFFGPMCLVGDCDAGHGGPIRLSVVLAESDVDSVDGTPGYFFGSTLDDWLLANDHLGSASIGWSSAELQIQLPNEGDFFEQELRLNGGTSLGGSSDYRLVVRVRRLADHIR